MMSTNGIPGLGTSESSALPRPSLPQMPAPDTAPVEDSKTEGTSGTPCVGNTADNRNAVVVARLDEARSTGLCNHASAGSTKEAKSARLDTGGHSVKPCKVLMTVGMGWASSLISDPMPSLPFDADPNACTTPFSARPPRQDNEFHTRCATMTASKHALCAPSRASVCAKPAAACTILTEARLSTAQTHTIEVCKRESENARTGSRSELPSLGFPIGTRQVANIWGD